MAVVAAAHDIALVEVVRPDGVECGDVACHPRHETRHEGCEAEAQHAVGIITVHQRRQREVEVAFERCWCHDRRDHARDGDK